MASDDHDSVEVRPIERRDLDRIPLRCWPGSPTLDRLFQAQGTIGMAAWEGDRCVGQLHCYEVAVPHGSNEHWTHGGNNWWDTTEEAEVFTDFQRWGPGRVDLPVAGAAWCHGCFHVGRTLDSYRQELETGWSPESPGTEANFAGRGIGTALCEESIRWAQRRGHVAVVAPGAPPGLVQFASWAGHLPWTTYARRGFVSVDSGNEGDPGHEGDRGLPGWARWPPAHDAPGYLRPPEPVVAEVREALDTGRPPAECRERLMLLQLAASG